MTPRFDEDLSFRLVDQLADLFPHRPDVRVVGLMIRPDEEILGYAVLRHYALVSKDVDFYSG